MKYVRRRDMYQLKITRGINKPAPFGKGRLEWAIESFIKFNVDLSSRSRGILDDVAGEGICEIQSFMYTLFSDDDL